MEIAIVGGAIGGLFAANALVRRGIEAEIRLATGSTSASGSNASRQTPFGPIVTTAVSTAASSIVTAAARGFRGCTAAVTTIPSWSGGVNASADSGLTT